MRLAITGITSGVGVRLAEIALARGDSVAGLVRSPSREDACALASRGARLIPGDLANTAALTDLARGADAFLHLAAHVGDTGTPEEFERVNVRGTLAAIEAAAAARVPCFVQLSSVAVYGRPEQGRVVETWPRRTCGSPYEDTKSEAERVAFEIGKARGVAVIAVRPPVIYGPHDRNFMPRILAALAATLPPHRRRRRAVQRGLGRSRGRRRPPGRRADRPRGRSLQRDGRGRQASSSSTMRRRRCASSAGSPR